MKEILNYLYQGNYLGRKESEVILTNIGQNKYSDIEVASFITVYLMRRITPEELTGFRDALLKLCNKVELNGFETIDVCGTGGDGKHTFNISTLSAFVLAGAGFRVAKHGNYAVSSSVGSSNLFEYLGYRFTNDEKKLLKEVETAGITFMHAPLFHPAMKCVAPVRKALQIKTFFNMLGPMINPASPDYQMIGVYSTEVQDLYANIYHQSDCRFMIIHGLDGYDEISLTGKARIISREKEETIDPSAFGFEKAEEEALFGGNNVTEAASIFLKVLNNEGTSAQKNVVVANSAAAIHCINPDRSWTECASLAGESIESGKALEAFNHLISLQ